MLLKSIKKMLLGIFLFMVGIILVALGLLLIMADDGGIAAILIILGILVAIVSIVKFLDGYTDDGEKEVDNTDNREAEEDL